MYQNGKIYKVTFDNCDNAPSNDKTLENVEKRSEITLGKNGSIVRGQNIEYDVQIETEKNWRKNQKVRIKGWD